MKKLLATIICCAALIPTFAQDSTRLKFLYQSEQYDDMTTLTSRPDTLSAPALYYLSLAYHMKTQDSLCLSMMDMAIAKAPGDPRLYYVKATVLLYQEKFKEAISLYQECLKYDPNNANSYTGMGDAYYYLEDYKMALQSYHKANSLPGPSSHSLLMVPQIYVDTHEEEKALTAFYAIKNNIDKEEDNYKLVLFNIGNLEIKAGRHEKAQPFIEELLRIDSTDYMAMAKLIQICYHNKDYKKGNQYKAVLYAANAAGKMTNMKDKFCFDRYRWKDKEIYVFERYQSGSSENIYNKIIFMVVSNVDSVEMTIQTEYSPFSKAFGGSTYLLCGNQDGVHMNYGIGYNDDVNYDELKSTVMAILENKRKPQGTSRVGSKAKVSN